MTYCVGLSLDQGIVLLADTRTNAGVDNISTFSKLTVAEKPGERVLALMSAGNLAITQSVVSLVTEGLVTHGEAPHTLFNTPTMADAAKLVGDAVRQVFERDGDAMQKQRISFDCDFLLAGQIEGARLRLFQLYAAGNYIEATPDTPFLQIGEHKYGKPILDRVARYDTPIEEAVKLACISMDSTLRSNLSVGLPADLLVLRRDALVSSRRRITEADEYFRSIREGWSAALRETFLSLPNPPWPLG